jgi:vacuolar-type H+-ATPase subunit C/Vma6
MTHGLPDLSRLANTATAPSDKDADELRQQLAEIQERLRIVEARRALATSSREELVEELLEARAMLDECAQRRAAEKRDAEADRALMGALYAQIREMKGRLRSDPARAGV